MSAHGLATYQAVQTTTADPARLVLLLFDGAIHFLHRAERALDQGNLPAFAQNEARAHAIIAELRQALNHDAGGELAANLDRLYAFMLRHLAQGLVHRNRRCLSETAALLGTVREGFERAIAALGDARGRA